MNRVKIYFLFIILLFYMGSIDLFGQTTLWTQDFESTTVALPSAPSGWINTSGEYWGCGNTAGAHSGSKYMYIRYAWRSWLLSSGTALTAGTQYQFSFWYKNPDGLTGFTLRAGVNSSQSSTGITILGTISNPTNTGWSQVTYNFTPVSSGTYYFGVQNSSTSWDPNYLDIDDVKLVQSCAAPSISTPPSNSSVCSGAAASFSVVATGTATLYYQWKENGVNLSEGGVYSNVTTSTLNISNATGLNGKQYSCYVSNACGNVTSAVGTLSVVALPSVGTLTVNGSSAYPVQVCEGEAITVSHTGWNAQGGVMYYYVDNALLGGWCIAPDWEIISYGSITAANQVGGQNNVNNLNSFQFKINTAGTYIVHTNLYNSLGCYAGGANMWIQVNPLPTPTASSNTPQCSGGTLNLSVGAYNSYIWSGPNSFSSSSQNPSIASATTAATGTYNVTVTDGNGCQNSSSTPVTVNPTGAASVSIGASATTICSGTNVIFTATPTNGGTPTYQWKLNGGNVGSNSSIYSSTALNNNDAIACIMTSSNTCVSGSPATSNVITMTVNPTPTITGTTPGSTCGAGIVNLSASASAGTINWYAAASGGGSLGTGTNYTTPSISSTTNYYVDATLGGCTTAPRTTVIATVNSPASITVQPTSQSKCTGQSVSFSVTTVGSGLSYQWRKNGSNLSDGGNISGATTSSLTINPVALSDAADYDCVITGSCSPLSSNTATLSISITPSISTQPTSIINSNQSTASFSVLATGTSLTYQWQVSTNGGSIWNNISAAGSNPTYSGYTSSTLGLSGITQTCNAYQYRCIVSGSCAPSVTSNAATLSLYCVGGTYSFNGYSQGQTFTANSYTWSSGNMSVKISKTGANCNGSNNGGFTTGGGNWNTEGFCEGGPNSPKYAPRYITAGSGCCSGDYEYTGLLLNCDWQNKTSTVQVDITFATPICAPVSFNIWDINTWKSTYLYFSDVVIISATRPDATTIYPTITGLGGGNVYASASGTNGSGASNNASGTIASSTPSGSSGNEKTAVTATFSSGTISSIRIVYTSNSTIPDPAKATDPTWQYIIIGNITASNPTLPVELTEFSGNCIDEKVKLGWTTASETNNDYFNIEKSIDGSEFTSIGKLQGSGNSNDLLNYYYNDESGDCNNGCYYRLQQVDYNGDYNYSEIIKVECSGNDSNFDNFTVFPNPATNEVFIDITPTIEGTVELLIFDSKGQLVFIKKLELIEGLNECKISTNYFERGLYCVVVTNEHMTKSKYLLITD